MLTGLDEQALPQLLRRLGATENYNGFPYIVDAVRLAAEDPERLRLITKALYPDIARRYGVTWQAVERSIRTVVSVVWASNPQLLAEVAGFPLRRKPNNARFLAILAGAREEES